MSRESNELIHSIDLVSNVVDENQKSTPLIISKSQQILANIDHIALSSENNSAATEQVSTSTRELESQLEDVMTSAISLKEMAGELQTALLYLKI